MTLFDGGQENFGDIEKSLRRDIGYMESRGANLDGKESLKALALKLARQLDHEWDGAKASSLARALRSTLTELRPHTAADAFDEFLDDLTDPDDPRQSVPDSDTKEP